MTSAVTTKDKSKRLIELVRGKTLLKDAPTRMDVILYVNGVDIAEDQKNLKRNLSALIRTLRKKEQKRYYGIEHKLHSHNDNQFYTLYDKSSKVWRCVHIIQEINGNYLLDYNRRIEKTIETKEQMVIHTKKRAMLSDELKSQLKHDMIKNRWSKRLVKEYCIPKQIKSYIKELKQEGKIINNYHPNINGIQYVFGENAGELKAMLVDQIDKKFDNYNNSLSDAAASAREQIDNIIKNMPKEIIMCDYNKVDYVRPIGNELPTAGWR